MKKVADHEGNVTRPEFKAATHLEDNATKGIPENHLVFESWNGEGKFVASSNSAHLQKLLDK